MSLNSTLFHGSFQLVGQQWWPLHYSIDSNFKHRSSRRCHIQHNDLSATSLSLLIALLRSLPDGPFLVGSFHIDCTGNRLQPTSTENSQEHHPLPLQCTMRYAYLCFFSLLCPFTIFSLWHSLRTLDTNTASDCRSIYMMSEKKTSYLDSIGAPRQALCPAMMSALPLLYQLLFLLDHKSDLSLLRVWWSIPFSLHLQHVSQLPQDFVKSSIISLLSQNY